MKAPVVVVVAALLASSACEIAQPFEGPKFGIGEGLLGDPQDAPYIVAATFIELKDEPGVGERFDRQVDLIVAAQDEVPGFVGRSLRKEFGGRKAWTMSAYENEEAMIEFVGTDAHLDAIDIAQELASDARVTHWEVDAKDLPPSWEEAKARLDTDGLSLYGN